MGPLIFMARRHQIKRKKSTLQYRLMQVNNQRQQIAEQMGQANKQKALRQSLFNITNQMAMNNATRDLMTRLMNNNVQADRARNLENGTGSNYLSGAINNGGIYDAYYALQNQNLMNNLLNGLGSAGDEAELGQLQMIDSQLEQEQTSLENQLKLLEAEEQAVEKQMDQEIKNSAPKFGLSG